MSVSSGMQPKQTWSRPRFIEPTWLRWTVYIGIAAYFIFAGRSVNIDIARIIRGMEYGKSLVTAFLQPDFVSRGPQIVTGVMESVTMMIAGTLLGLLFTIPISLGAARNISPLPIYLVCRGILMVFRSLHVVILAIFFVVMFGFGPFAGVLTVIVNGVGFLGKLLAESIETINRRTLEAVRSTGATWLQVVAFAVWPQIAARFAGLAIYRADQGFRESTVIGLVGAGGVGAVLSTAMGRYDYNTAAAILIVIVALVMLGEYASGAIRRRLT